MQDANWTNDSWMEDNRGKMAVFFHTVQVQNNIQNDDAKSAQSLRKRCF
jgi:hypothetical protein